MNKIKKTALNIGIIICAIAVLFSSYKIISTIVEYRQSTVYYNKLAEKYFNTELFNKCIGGSSNAFNSIVDFAGLNDENDDIIGWIVCPNTKINYPIVVAEDNDFYLYRMTNKKNNSSGALFLDYNNKSDFTDYNSVIYGHSMKNGGMFAALNKYKTQALFDEHQVMYLFTPSAAYELRLLCGFETDGNSDLYLVPGNAGLCASLVKEGMEKSTFKSAFDYSSGEKTVTLSTCGYKDELDRYAIVCKLCEIKK